MLFTAITPLLLPSIGKQGLRGNALTLSFLYSQNTRYRKHISLAAVSYEVSRKQNTVVETVMVFLFPESNFLKAGFKKKKKEKEKKEKKRNIL